MKVRVGSVIGMNIFIEQLKGIKGAGWRILILSRLTHYDSSSTIITHDYDNHLQLCRGLLLP